MFEFLKSSSPVIFPLIGFCVSIYSVNKTIKDNSKQNRSIIVSQEMNKWRKEVRDKTTKLISLYNEITNNFDYAHNEERNRKIILDIETSFSGLILLLNNNEKELVKLLKNIKQGFIFFSFAKSDYNSETVSEDMYNRAIRNIEILTSTISKYLNKEWNKMKLNIGENNRYNDSKQEYENYLESFNDYNFNILRIFDN